MEIINQWITMIEHSDSVEDYRTAIKDILSQIQEISVTNEIEELQRELIKELEIKENVFSKVETKRNLERCKERICFRVQKIGTREEKTSATEIIRKILCDFPIYCRFLFQDRIHGKCNQSLIKHLPELAVENEYDVQHFIYPVIRILYDDARMEETEDTGHHMVRKDIVIDSEDIAIELKCTRKTMTEKQLSEEIASDMVHYTNKYLFFFIYDQAKIILNEGCFRDTYEKKNIDEKQIFVIIVS